MAAPSAILTHGSSIDLVDEPSVSSVIQCESFTFKGVRDRRESRRYDGAITRIQERNPRAEMSYDGYIIGAGLAIQEAGSEVASLSNFASTRHGCDPAVGTMVMRDPTDSFSVEDDVKISFMVDWLPFV